MSLPDNVYEENLKKVELMKKAWFFKENQDNKKWGGTDFWENGCFKLRCIFGTYKFMSWTEKSKVKSIIVGG